MLKMNVKKLQLGSWKPLKNWRKMTVKILSWSQKKWRLNNENHFQLGYQEKHGESKLCVRSNETCKIHKGWKATNQCRQRNYAAMVSTYDLWISNTLVFLKFYSVTKTRVPRGWAKKSTQTFLSLEAIS